MRCVWYAYLVRRCKTRLLYVLLAVCSGVLLLHPCMGKEELGVDHWSPAPLLCVVSKELFMVTGPVLGWTSSFVSCASRVLLPA